MLLVCVYATCFAQSDSTYRPKPQAMSYQTAISKADLAIGSKDFLTAKRFYKKALDVKPGDTYAQTQIDVCDRKLSTDGFMTSDWECPCKNAKKGGTPPENVLDVYSADSVISCSIPGVVIGISEDSAHHVMLVVIKHGKYFTSYSNLDHVSVKMGDDLKEGDKIGVPIKENGEYKLEFSVFHGKEKEDPMLYVRCH